MKYGTTTILDRKVVSNPKVKNLWGGISTDVIWANDLVYNEEGAAVGLLRQYVPVTACYVKSGLQDEDYISKKDLRNFTKRAWDLTKGNTNFFRNYND